MLLLLFVVIGVTVAGPVTSVSGKDDWNVVIKDANEAKSQFEALSKEEQDAVGTVMDILADQTLSADQKKQKIHDLVKEAPEDAQKEVDDMTQKSLAFNTWLQDRLKTEDPAVQTACNKILGNLMNMKFIMSTDEEKKQQLSNTVKDLTPTQLAVIDKIDEESKAKEKELGI